MSPSHSSLPSTASRDPQPFLAGLLENPTTTTSVEAAQERTTRQLRILDVAVATGIVTLLVVLLIPTLYTQKVTLPLVTRNLIEQLRLTRAEAASRGAHFRVTFHPRSYAIEQLQDVDGDGRWTADTSLPAWRIPLPTAVTVSEGAGTVMEFDSKGFVTSVFDEANVAAVTIRLQDARSGDSNVIQILSSGKIQRS
ncbi:MAG: GspH/FimT family pseudopilin [Candidatus Binatia bacterium]